MLKEEKPVQNLGTLWKGPEIAACVKKKKDQMINFRAQELEQICN